MDAKRQLIFYVENVSSNALLAERNRPMFSEHSKPGSTPGQGFFFYRIDFDILITYPARAAPAYWFPSFVVLCLLSFVFCLLSFVLCLLSCVVPFPFPFACIYIFIIKVTFRSKSNY